MTADPNSDKLIVRYLLGELPEEQQIEIEDRAFQDKEYLAAITAVENDLIDEYVREELSETERRKFEARFLASAERRKRVEFAKALAKVTAKEAVPKRAEVTPAASSWRDSLEAFIRGLNPVGKFAFAAIVLLMLLGGAWLVTETLRLRSQNERQAAQQQQEAERRPSEEVTAQVSPEKQQPERSGEASPQPGETPDGTHPARKPVIASLTLLPGVSRGGGEKPKLVLPENAQLVRLQIGIDPEEPYKSFTAELRTAAGHQIWTRGNLPARERRGGRAVPLTLPANLLKPGEYELKLSGVAQGGRTEDVGFYYFDVKQGQN